MYAKIVDKWEVDKLVKSGAMLIDMRSPIDFRNGSVDGAVNLPLKNFLNTITGLKKNTKLIVFGNSDEDKNNVQTGINYATQLGFNNLYVSDFNSLK